MEPSPYASPQTLSEPNAAAGEDPVVRSGRKEALAVLGLWLGAMSWSVGVSVWLGYRQTELKFVLGFPQWVFWGVLAPWVTCVALCTVYALGFMRDEPLGEELPETDDGIL